MVPPILSRYVNNTYQCHPQWFPKDDYEYTSYVQCVGTMLNADEMMQVWDVACPHSERGKEAEASPLLGRVEGLPPHLVFVAGQDPLRDEAVAYVEKMEKAGVLVKWHIYQGYVLSVLSVSQNLRLPTCARLQEVRESSAPGGQFRGLALAPQYRSLSINLVAMIGFRITLPRYGS